MALKTSDRIYIEKEFKVESARLEALFMAATSEERKQIAEDYRKLEAALAQMKTSIAEYNAAVAEWKKELTKKDRGLWDAIWHGLGIIKAEGEKLFKS